MSNQATSEHSPANPEGPEGTDGQDGPGGLQATGIGESPGSSPVRTAIWLALIILCCLPPLLIDAGTPAPRHWMEAVSLHTSRETWINMHEGDGSEWIAPTSNGKLRVKKPPMLVWLNLLAWSDLEKDADPQVLAARARMVTASLAVVLIVCVFWIGCMLGGGGLGGSGVGLLAALVAGTLPFLQGQARMASYDMHLTTWVTLAVAGGLWAMQSRDGTRFRIIVGWGLSGLALGAAWMTKGPLSALLFAIPMVSIIALTPGRRKHGVIGVAVALAICAAIVTPWYVHVLSADGNTLERLKHEYSGQATNTQRPYYYLLNLFKLALPWTLWLIGGLVMPFKTKAAGERKAMFIAWWWFVGILLALSINPGKAERYILPIVPPLALLVGWVFARHATMAREGEPDRQINLLRVPHWIGLALASIVLAVLLGWPNWLADREWFDVPNVISVGALTAIGACIAMLLMVSVGAREHIRWRRGGPGRAALATGLWTIIAATTFWRASAGAEHELDAARDGGARVAAIVDDAPLRNFRFKDDDGLEHAFLYYLGRVVTSIRPSEDDPNAVLDKHIARGDGTPVYLLSLDTQAHRDVLLAYGFEPVLECRDTPSTPRVLWRFATMLEE